MAIQASKIISLTDKTTGNLFKLSANKISKFTASGSDTLLTYISKSGVVITKLVDETVSTINTAAARTQAVTIVGGPSDGVVIYLHSDKLIYLDTVTAGTLINYYDDAKDGPVQYQVVETAADINTAAANTLAVTIQATAVVRYINNLFIDLLVIEAVNDSATLLLKMKPESYTVTAAGTLYTSTPTIAVTGGGGAGATATATMKAISATPSAAGSGYDIADTATLTGGTSTTASILSVATTKLVSLTINAAGTGMVAGTTVLTLVGGTHSITPTATVTHTKVVSATVAAGGTGDLTDGSGVIVEGTTGTGTKFRASVTIATNAIASVQSITVAGDYTINPTAIATEPVTYISGAGGGTTLTGAQLNVVMGALTAVITVAGSFTVQTTTFTSTGGGGDATFQTALYGVLTTTVNTAGSYTVLPANPAAQGSTTGAGTGATFTVSWGVNTVVLGIAGAGYTSMPVVAITGGAGSGATAVAVMEGDVITVVDGGANYNTVPTLGFSGGGGTLLAATVTVTAQRVSSVAITTPGGGYTSFPTMTLSGGAGCQVMYDAKLPEFVRLQIAESAADLQTAVNAL